MQQLEEQIAALQRENERLRAQPVVRTCPCSINDMIPHAGCNASQIVVGSPGPAVPAADEPDDVIALDECVRDAEDSWSASCSDIKHSRAGQAVRVAEADAKQGPEQSDAT